VALSCLPLEVFLQDARLAGQIDNAVVRLLLWPHVNIPDGGFIDGRHDSDLVGEALSRLEQFDYVDVYENPEWVAGIEAWLDRALPILRINDTGPVAPQYQTRLDKELTFEACKFLELRSRLDRQLWSAVVRKRLLDVDVHAVEMATRLSNAAKFARLLYPEWKSDED
jgi:hypothetical protein